MATCQSNLNFLFLKKNILFWLLYVQCRRIIKKKTKLKHKAVKHCISDDLIKLNWKQCQDLYYLVLMIFWIKKMIRLPRCHTPCSHYMCIQAQKWKSEKNKIPKPKSAWWCASEDKKQFLSPPNIFPLPQCIIKWGIHR